MDGCMTYTIEQVGTPKDINTKYGDMKVYKIRLEGELDTVDYMISSKSPAPSIGDILEGTIGHNDFGAYFKKDKKPYTPGVQSKPVANTDAMYTSYAKDLVIAYMNAISWDFAKFDEVAINLLQQNVRDIAKILSAEEK
jgi:hypothetical protein